MVEEDKSNLIYYRNPTHNEGINVITPISLSDSAEITFSTDFGIMFGGRLDDKHRTSYTEIIDTFSNFDFGELTTYSEAEIRRQYYGFTFCPKINSDQSRKFSFSLGLGISFTSSINSSLYYFEHSNLTLSNTIDFDGQEHETHTSVWLDNYIHIIQKIENPTFLDLYIPFSLTYRLFKKNNFLNPFSLILSYIGGRE